MARYACAVWMELADHPARNNSQPIRICESDAHGNIMILRSDFQTEPHILNPFQCLLMYNLSFDGMLAGGVHRFASNLCMGE